MAVPAPEQYGRQMANKTKRRKSPAAARAAKNVAKKTKKSTTTRAKTAKAKTAKKSADRRAPPKPSRRKAPAKKRAASKKPGVKALMHPVFGRVTADPTEGLYWQKTLRLADRDVAVDVTIDDPREVTMELLDSAAQLVSRLGHFDALARAGLQEGHDENAGPAVALYVAHHLHALSEETLLRIFGKPKETIGAEDVLARLHLARVGSYPAKSGGSATFDYTIDADESQYVLAVQLDESGRVVGIAMES